MKLLLSLLLLLISPGVQAAPLDNFPPPSVPALSLPPVLPLPLPPPHQPGDLARDRLGEMAPVLLTAVRVSVGGFGKPVLTSAHAKAVIAALSDLVLDDSLYVSDAHYDGQDKSRAVVLEIGEPGEAVTVTVWQDKPLMTITRNYPGGRVYANYLPVLPKVVKLLRTVDPDSPGLNRTLVTAPSAPSTEGVPASVQKRIATLKPGMTRADVLHLFTTEGGISTPYWNHYVYRSGVPSKPGQQDDMLGVPGGFVKVNVDFAPPDADIVWLSGRGFWIRQAQYQQSHDRLNHFGNPSDIVLKVSPPYVQYIIID